MPFFAFFLLSLSGLDLRGEVCPADVARFPFDGVQAQDCYEIARDHSAWISAACARPGAACLRPDLLARYGDQWPFLWRQEAAARRAAWDALDNAWRSSGSHPYWKRDPGRMVRELTRLRDVIGPEAYRAGVMPEPVPFEFFSERPRP